MKRIRINEGFLGLVFKKGDYKRFITAGLNWIGFNETVKVYDVTNIFIAPIALEILLKDKQLAALMEVVEVRDDEIVLVYENKNFKNILKVGRYVYWKGLIEREFVKVDLSKIEITEPVNKAIFDQYQLNQYIKTFEVFAYEKAILLVDDIYKKTLSAGIYRFWRNNTSIKIAKADMRQLQLEIAGQELLTKDKAAIRINFYTQYKVIDIEKALLENKDYEKQLYVAMQLLLRAYVGRYTLDELLERKENIANTVFQDIKTVAEQLGLKIVNCGIRDVILTGEMKEIMNQVLIAQKRAQANIITRREETASTRSLLNTAKLMEDNEMLFKLKEMEYVEKIAEKVGEITVNGNGNMVKQLKEMFTVMK